MPKVSIRYKKNKHQEEFQEDIKTKYLHMSSGFGGGKSYGIAMKAFQLSFLNKGIRGGCVVPSISDFKKDLLPIFEDILELNNIDYKYHKSDKWFRFPWSNAHMQIASAENKLRGPNWGWCVINEATLMPHERYKEAIGRVRIKNAPNPQIASSGTPEGTAHWAYDAFVEKPMRRSRIIYGDTRDNQDNLSEDYIESLEESYDKVMLDAYLRGMFVNMASNRFYYAYDPMKNEDRMIERRPHHIVHVAMDFNVDPMCASLWHVVPMKQDRFEVYHTDGRAMFTLECFGQIKLGGPDGADTNQMCNALIARDILPDATIIYPDPAGKARSTMGDPNIEIIRNRGYTNIRVKNVAPQFRKRQLAHNNVLDKGMIKVNPVTAPDVKKDYEAVEQDIATLGKVKKNPKLTHFSDGIDYMVDILFPLSGNKPQLSMGRRI